MIHPRRRPSLYRAVADDLRRRIRAGEFSPGSTLPAERDIAAQYGSGGNTVAAALRVLQAEGLITIRHGARALVRDTPEVSVVDVPPGHRVGARMPTPEEREELGIDEGVPVLVIIEIATGVQVDMYPADRTEVELQPRE